MRRVAQKVFDAIRNAAADGWRDTFMQGLIGLLPV